MLLIYETLTTLYTEFKIKFEIHIYLFIHDVSGEKFNENNEISITA